MNIVINKDLQELTKLFESNSKFNVRSLASHEISNQAIKDSDAVFLRSTTKINEELLDNTNVKFVASLTSGEDHIDQDYFKNSNIHLSTGKGGNALAVIEYLLSVLSVLIIGNKIKPYETKFGIIGFGNIGKRFKNILDEINFPVIKAIGPFSVIFTPEPYSRLDFSIASPGVTKSLTDAFIDSAEAVCHINGPEYLV